MQHELFIAVLAGLGGMLGWGFADFFAKKTIDEIGDIVSLAWGHVFGTIALLLMALYYLAVRGQQITVPHSFQTWFLLLLFGAVQATVYLLVYKGFGKGQVAVLNPVFASFSGLTAILSIVLFGEAVSGYLLLGLATLFIGILLISIDVQALASMHLSFSYIPGFREVGLATLLAALWTLFWGKFVGGKDWLSYALFMYIFMTFAILIVSKLYKIDLHVVKSSVWKYLVLIGLCETVAYLAISLGYSATLLTSIVALLSGAFSLPTILLARTFLKEKITATQTIGSLIIIAGIMLLSVL